MAYADQQALSANSDFQNRVWACLTSESAAKDPGTDELAEYILADPWQGVKLFMPLLATAPTFGDKYAAGGQESIADGEILAATQAAWPRVQVPG